MHNWQCNELQAANNRATLRLTSSPHACNPPALPTAAPTHLPTLRLHNKGYKT
jgi:hypothetical protein